jgi:hypothetical protein
VHPPYTCGGLVAVRKFDHTGNQVTGKILGGAGEKSPHTPLKKKKKRVFFSLFYLYAYQQYIAEIVTDWFTVF